MLGELRTVPAWCHAAGAGLALVTWILWVRLQAVVARLKAVEGRSRWASNERDLIALGGATGLTLAFVLSGLPVAAAILFACTLGIVLELLRRQSGRMLRGGLAVTLMLTAVVTFWPSRILSGANTVTRWIIPQAIRQRQTAR